MKFLTIYIDIHINKDILENIEKGIWHKDLAYWICWGEIPSIICCFGSISIYYTSSYSFEKKFLEVLLLVKKAQAVYREEVEPGSRCFDPSILGFARPGGKRQNILLHFSCLSQDVSQS